MTSVVYVLLRRKPEIVDNLFAVTFKMDIAGQEKFKTARHGKHDIELKSLARGYLRQDLQQQLEVRQLRARGMFGQAQAKDHRRQHDMPSYIVDYMLSRALGYLFKKTAKERYDKEKADFNVKFDSRHGQPSDYRYITRAGSLALRTRNVAFILEEIVGAQNVHITRNTSRPQPLRPVARAKSLGRRVSEDNFSTAQELGSKFTAHFTPGDRSRFAIAAIFGNLLHNRNYRHNQPNIRVPGQPAAWTLNGVEVAGAGHNPISSNSTRDARDTALEYNHWVVIEGFNLTPNAAELLIWTWGKYYRVNVRPQNLLSYIQDVIFGQFA